MDEAPGVNPGNLLFDRIGDVANELGKPFKPLQVDGPVPSFHDALKPLSSIIPKLDELIADCENWSQTMLSRQKIRQDTNDTTKIHGIDLPAAMAIHLMTRESLRNREDSFYF